MPHLAADPVTVMAEIVLALQTAVTRQFDALDPVVVIGREGRRPGPSTT